MIFLLLLSIFLPSASSSIPVDPPVSFSFSSFNPKSCSDGSLICMGAVTPSYGYLSLTSDPSPESPDQLPLKKVGRVLYSQPVTAWPAMISTTFTIRISPYPNTTDSADGMTFVFATDTSPPTENSAGGNLGLSNGVSQLAVELDTYKNDYWSDPDANHMGIDIANLTSNPAKSLDSSGIDLKSGRPIQVHIYYDGWTKILYVYVAYAGNPLQKLIERPIPLSETIPSSVYVGFTASTGPDFSESHQVLDWTFTTFPLPSSSLEEQNLAMPI
ncbi:hypothetical protein KPL70_000507 [Citrus sinensis]|uniref:Legume lectin domain-containing protein n=1 Tax=Citrus sinensis TaxID=2711 RepID=A0A067GK30_CITSI|nr:seed lectin-like [Citrus sinensis]KAH9761592.1 hypothetical protein KPL70_000507 [Citrus sinensis]KDO80083.1 hypothetical protein CISIN_1g024176mg [Citrus sinensis]